MYESDTPYSGQSCTGELQLGKRKSVWCLRLPDSFPVRASAHSCKKEKLEKSDM